MNIWDRHTYGDRYTDADKQTGRNTLRKQNEYTSDRERKTNNQRERSRTIRGTAHPYHQQDSLVPEACMKSMISTSYLPLLCSRWRSVSTTDSAAPRSPSRRQTLPTSTAHQLVNSFVLFEIFISLPRPPALWTISPAGLRTRQHCLPSSSARDVWRWFGGGKFRIGPLPNLVREIPLLSDRREISVIRRASRSATTTELRHACTSWP